MDTPYDVVIIGGGLSGLSVAHFLRKRMPAANLLILEKDSRPGGAIRSFTDRGFLAEWGPHGFLDNVEESRQLLVDTGLDSEAQKAPLSKFVRYICLQGKLAMIPQNPKKILASSLLPVSKKLRVLADLWIKPRQEEQTVGEWAAYRFGKGILPFVDAVFTGTYAGDFNRLSIDAVMPGIRGLEKETGSVIRGLLKQRKRKKEKGPRKRSGLPAMISFPQGMERLPEVLARDKNLLCDMPAESIDKKNDAWEIKTARQNFKAKNVVLALSVNRTLRLLDASSLSKGKPPPMNRIPEARIATVALGFTDTARVPFGFGYLAPEQEKRFALGALFSTHMFPGRAPEGHVMLEALVGGRRHPDRLDLSDDELIDGAYRDLGQLIHLPDPPVFSKVLRSAHGIPQLEKGYLDLIDWRTALTKRNSGLFICGFGWEGIGINDMTRFANKLADEISEQESATTGKAEVKGVYF